MKHIISCSDGTWNRPSATESGQALSLTQNGKKIKVTDEAQKEAEKEAGNGRTNGQRAKPLPPDKSTNVVKMYNCICNTGEDERKRPIPQVKVYDEGVGTGYGFLDRIVSGATGRGLDKNIKDVYRFFMLNYQPGDRLFLFGFSRGAYTARSLAGFIRNCGILRPENMHVVNEAYALYRERNVYSHPDSDLMKSFRRTYSHKENENDVTPIHFMGVWDTVGALGIPLRLWQVRNRRKYSFHDVKLGSHVLHAYHALALDEKRRQFSPALWEKSQSVLDNPDHPQHRQFEQRWFRGAHSNVGGGYPDRGLSNRALEWVMEKAKGAGLCFNAPPLIETGESDKGKAINSLMPLYWLSGWKTRTPKLNGFECNQTMDESAV